MAETKFFYTHRLQKEQTRRLIISQESVASLAWKAASGLSSTESSQGRRVPGRSDGPGIRQARKEKKKVNETPDEKVKQWKENIRRK